MVTDEAHAAVLAENAQLRQQVTDLQEQLRVALERIRRLEATKTPPPSFVKANVPERATPKPARKKRAAEHNRARRREAEPTQIIEHRIAACPECGSRLGGVSLARQRQVIELPPPPTVVVTEHRVYQGWCSACRRWHEAPLDLSGQVVGQSRVGVRLSALVAHLRTSLRLPLRTIVRYLVDLHGLRLSVGEIVDLLHRVAARGASTVQQITEHARARAVVHADETGWREAGRNGYVWLLSTPEGERVYTFDRSRSGRVINGLLGEAFRGVLVTDFYGAYNDTPGGQHQRCWVHLLRDVQALGEAHPLPTSLLALEVRSWTQAVVALWSRVQAVATSPPETPALVRERAGRELLGEVHALGAQFLEQMGHPCRPLAWRLWHFADELLTCVRQPGVPCDNNQAERDLRPLVIARKISGGSRSPRGSATRMTLASLFATWTAQGHDPLLDCQRLLQSPLPQV